MAMFSFRNDCQYKTRRERTLFSHIPDTLFFIRKAFSSIKVLDASGQPLTVVSFVGKFIFSRTFFICSRVPPSAPKFVSGDLTVFAAVCSFQSLKVSFSLFKVSITIESLELI